MKNIRCPKCHKKFDLQDLVLDETVNRIFSIFLNIKDVNTKNLLLEYMQLFKVEDDLSYAETLNILESIQKIDSFENLANALDLTVKALANKNSQLMNHYYLIKVHKSIKESNLNEVVKSSRNKETTTTTAIKTNPSFTNLAVMELEELLNEFQ